MEHNSTDEKDLATRQSRQAVDCKCTRLSDSVLGLDRIHEHPLSIEAWKEKIEWFTKCQEYRELDCVDGEPVEFEWKIFPGHTTLQLRREIQMTMEENRIQPQKFEDRIIFMLMNNNIDWNTEGNKEICISNSSEVEAYAKRCPKGH